MYTGKLTILRAMKKEDLPLKHEYFSSYTTRYLANGGIMYPELLEDEYKWYQEISAFNKEKYTFAIERIMDKLFIGCCTVKEIDWKNRNAYVSISLGEDFLGQGYGTDAMRTLVNFCFQELNLHKIQLCVFSYNPRAIRSYEKVGFRHEGACREMLYREGKFHAEIYMGILRSELQMEQ